jgi:hypothetical protein
VARARVELDELRRAGGGEGVHPVGPGRSGGERGRAVAPQLGAGGGVITVDLAAGGGLGLLLSIPSVMVMLLVRKHVMAAISRKASNSDE